MKRIFATFSLVGMLFLFGLIGTAVAQTPATVSVRLLDTLSSENSKFGDRFTATLAEPLVMNGRIVARKDTRVTGQVRDAVSSGRLHRPALLTLSLMEVESLSRKYPVATGDLTVKADSHATRNVLIIGGSSGAGAVIGGVAGGGKGAAIGALIGAGAGTAGAYLTGKREIVLPAETLLTFRVNSVTISPKELARLQPFRQVAEDSPRTNAGYDERGSYPVVVRRYRYEEDEDDDDQGEDEHEHRFEHPRRIDVVFLGRHQAEIMILWPERTERLTLHGDGLDDILEPLSEYTKVSVRVLRARVKIERED